jgi:uncharacterized protein YbjT (DUF2867 family)
LHAQNVSNYTAKIMSGKTATIIGATGMIGTYLRELLEKDSYFETIRIMVRRPVPKPSDKTEVKLVDFNDAESVKLALEGTDMVFCAIGTTQKNVKGDKDLYRRIDLDIPVKVARFAKEAGCEKFIIITSVGANSKSKQFYLKLKGELEEALQAIGFRSLHIMQPSMLLGDRTENRPTERMLQGSTKFISRFLTGSFRKYRAIQGKTVAMAMINASKKDEPGVYRYTYDEIVKTAG